MDFGTEISDGLLNHISDGEKQNKEKKPGFFYMSRSRDFKCGVSGH